MFRCNYFYPDGRMCESRGRYDITDQMTRPRGFPGDVIGGAVISEVITPDERKIEYIVHRCRKHLPRSLAALRKNLRFEEISE